MSMIACPECGKEISDKAASCPGCGAPIAGQQETVVMRDTFLYRNRGCLESTLWLMLIFGIIIAVGRAILR